MKDKPVILIVDDQPQNIELLEAHLVPQGYEIVKAATGEKALEKLSTNQIELILMDVLMPGTDGFEVTRRIRRDTAHRLIPIILISVLHETEDRVKGIEAGCDDFLSKPIDKMELFARVRSLLKVKAYNDLMSDYQTELEAKITSRTEELRHALENLQQEITERKQAEDALNRKHTMLARTEAVAHVGSWEWEVEGDKVTWSEELFRIFGLEPMEEAPPYKEHQTFYVPEDRMRLDEAVEECLRNSVPYDLEVRITRTDGQLRHCVVRGIPEHGADGAVNRLYGSLHDITERKRAEATLRLQSLVLDQIEDRVTVTDLNGVITYVNDAEVRALGYSRDELIGVTTDKYGEDPEKGSQQRQIVKETLEKGAWRGQIVNQTVAGEDVILDCRKRVVHDEQGNKIALAEISTDITDLKKMEAQFAQAQKMESVGCLAGGVAHDFNNMIGVILGHAEFALEKAKENHDLYADLKEIQTAARRSADLTKQLLAFARKQIISPKRINLNDAVECILNMLRRLIGEGINLSWNPAKRVWPVKMDPSQVDQILANLCVNARDAIEGVGKLTIETGMKTFDPAYCADHAGFVPGDFVVLAVSDDGCGMDKMTLNNLFEPFFTTKDVGKGTGLGLATVYGIVKQNNGFINVYSEPDIGTTFRIYLPRYAAADESPTAIHSHKPDPMGNETVLLVEDEPAILRMARMMLDRMGYSVLPAATPAEAIDLAKTHADKIHLLMTDVVMPEMNGRDLAKHLTGLYPDLKLLFMSGYTTNVVAHHGVLDEKVAFIQKPFSMKDLAEKVREILDTALDKNQCVDRQSRLRFCKGLPNNT